MLGVALEGGGAKGAFHIGALKALLENGYKIEGAVGTSIGAFNAALFSQGDFDKAYEIWANMEPSTLFDIEDEHMRKLLRSDIDRSTIKYLTGKTKGVIGNRGIDVSKLRSVLEHTISEEKLRKSPIDFGLVTVSLTDRKPVKLYKEDIPEGKVNDYIMASANFPGFKMEAIDGKYFIDGGLYDNCPVSLLIDKGYTDILAIRTTINNKSSKNLYSDANLISIVPSEELGRAFIFDNDLLRKNIRLGYFDTLKVIHNLKGRKYYIKQSRDELFFYIISNVPEEVIIQIGKILKLPNMESKRMLFEKIIPAIADLLKLPTDATYQDILIGLLEILAEKKNVNRFEIYTINELIEAIEKSYPLETTDNKRKIRLINIKKITSQLLGNNILDELSNVILDIFPFETLKIDD